MLLFNFTSSSLVVSLFLYSIQFLVYSPLFHSYSGVIIVVVGDVVHSIQQRIRLFDFMRSLLTAQHISVNWRVSFFSSFYFVAVQSNKQYIDFFALIIVYSVLVSVIE